LVPASDGGDDLVGIGDPLAHARSPPAEKAYTLVPLEAILGYATRTIAAKRHDLICAMSFLKSWVIAEIGIAEARFRNSGCLSLGQEIQKLPLNYHAHCLRTGVNHAEAGEVANIRVATGVPTISPQAAARDIADHLRNQLVAAYIAFFALRAKLAVEPGRGRESLAEKVCASAYAGSH
jgi:hypothetical protein